MNRLNSTTNVLLGIASARKSPQLLLLSRILVLPNVVDPPAMVAAVVDLQDHPAAADQGLANCVIQLLC